MRPGLIWVGTNNGLVHVTRDTGRTWTDVSIPGLAAPRRSLVSSIEASYHAAGTAYVAIESLRTGDRGPHLFRTRDYGKSWTEINTGLPTDEPSGSVTRVLRADPVRAGLLFTGTESGVHVSFDDGDHWQSLTNDMPNTNQRDMFIKGNDLVVGTYGRGIWVLDDISMLRQVTPAIAAAPAHLFAPGEAVRMRRNVNADTPLPPEIPHAANPLPGAIIDYWLGATAAGEVTLDVLDASGAVIRHLSSVAEAPLPEALRPPAPNYWVAPPFALPTGVGAHRVNWDLRHDAAAALSHGFEINANAGLTPLSPEGALALPGTYTIRLTVDGKRYTTTVTVKNDPRSRATPVALRAQHDLMMAITAGMQRSADAHRRAVALRAAAVDAGNGAPADVTAAAAALVAGLDSLGAGEGGRGTGGQTFRGLNGTLAGQLTAQDNADLAPTPAMRAAYAKSCTDLRAVEARWTRLLATRLEPLNRALAGQGRTPVPNPPREGTGAIPSC